MGLTLNVIYDDRNISRYEPLMDEIKRQGITDYKIWEAVIDKRTVVESINASQKQIIRWAKETGQKMVWMAEDDLMFPNEKGAEYFLNNIPRDFDVYLAGSYLIDANTQYVSPVTKVKAYVGHHCIIVHEKYYDRFLSVPDDVHIDVAQDGLGDFYLCYPMAALQRPSRSANNNFEMTNYNAILQPEYIYK